MEDRRYRSARCDRCRWWVGLNDRELKGSFVYRQDGSLAGPGTPKADAFPHIKEMPYKRWYAQWNATWACSHCLPSLWNATWEDTQRWLNPAPPPGLGGRKRGPTKEDGDRSRRHRWTPSIPDGSVDSADWRHYNR